MTIKIKKLPEAERPYEKLELYGEQALSNAELLAIIIKTGTKDMTSVEVAQNILNLNDSEEEGLNFLRNIGMQELQQIKGVGKVKAIQLKALAELGARMQTPSNYKKVVIKKPYDLAKIFLEKLRFKKREIAKIVILNNKNEIIKIKDIAFGGTNFVNVSIKDIMIEPIKMNATKIILVHNHPSGDPTPSRSDIKKKKRVYEVAQQLDIQLLDHLIIGNQTYTSIFSKMLSRK